MKAPVVLQSKEGQWVVLGLVALIVVYYIGKKIVTAGAQAAGAAASATGGALSGNNSLTQGTPYEGAGILGTLGAATNTILGGAPEKIGNWIGGALPGNNYDPNAPTPSGVNRDQVVTQNYVTDIGQTTDFGTTDPNAGWD